MKKMIRILPFAGLILFAGNIYSQGNAPSRAELESLDKQACEQAAQRPAEEKQTYTSVFRNVSPESSETVSEDVILPEANAKPDPKAPSVSVFKSPPEASRGSQPASVSPDQHSPPPSPPVDEKANTAKSENQAAPLPSATEKRNNSAGNAQPEGEQAGKATNFRSLKGPGTQPAPATLTLPE